jgi:rhamnose utilization protein RhaD (predicted bifunctional aldolase and dehydrogenase)
MPAPDSLVALTHRLGDPQEGLAILAEGNTSTTVGADPDSFWVKASGLHMATIEVSGFVHVRRAPMLASLRESKLDDLAVKEVLAAARVDSNEKQMPSVETFMHAYLLGLPGVSWVGHTHPKRLLAILSRPSASHEAERRLFPDEVVCCGPATAFVPYTDPGLPLALAIKASVERYAAERGETPKTIWLANHGLIVLGSTPAEVISGTLMSEKAASVRLESGVEAVSLSAEQIERIHRRPDEHYRQALLRAMSV